MSRDVFVAGVGMIPFSKPVAHLPYPQMAAQATQAALLDAGVSYEQMQQSYVGYVYGDSTAGQRALYEVGMTGIPVINVNNNCSTALFLAHQAVASGAADCVLALGFEHMSPGALGAVFKDRPSPFDRFDAATDELVGHGEIALALRYFGGAGLAHMQQYGTQLETFAAIRVKASRHAVHNPLALFRKEVTTEEVMASPMLWDGVMTRLMACPPTCGAAAAVLCSHSVCAKARPEPSGAHQGASDDDRPAAYLRGARHARGGGFFHGTRSCQSGLCAGRRRPTGHRCGGTARLLRAERAHQLRGARPVPTGWCREVRA